MRPPTTIIAGVGRSGTTLLQSLATHLFRVRYGNAFANLYEPFLWDSEVLGNYPMDRSLLPKFLEVGARSEEGIYYHRALPLFFGDNTGIDELLARFPGLGAYLRSEIDLPLVGKFIRANGRLPLLRALYPDAKFIIALRNPLDVVNSVIAKFSFFGLGYHKNDYPKFCDEVQLRFGTKLPDDIKLTDAYKSGLWHHYLNQAAMQFAADDAGTIVWVYEDFLRHPDSSIERLCNHIGFEPIESLSEVVQVAHGPVTGRGLFLTKQEVESLLPFLDQHLSLLARVTTQESIERNAILNRYQIGNLPTKSISHAALRQSRNNR